MYMNFKLKTAVLVCFVCLVRMGFSQNATKYSNEFLQIGVGARSLGMGGSVLASSNDVYSGYWNPASLVKMEGNVQIALMHASYFAGIANYDYGAWATKISNNSALGISVVRFGVDGIVNTFDLIRNGEIDYNRVTSFNTSDLAIILSYAREEKINGYKNISFSWGANAKYIRRKVGPFAKANGFGFDISAQLSNEKKGLSFGAVLRDATSTFNSWRYTFTDAQKDVLAATQNAIPKNTLEITLPRLIVGVAKQWEKKNWLFLAETNLNFTTDGQRNVLVSSKSFNIDPTIGGEIAYEIDKKTKLFFRTGLNNFQRKTNSKGKTVSSVAPNIGLGIVLENFTLDYALSNLSAIGDSGAKLYSNIFSLKLAINKK